MPVLPAICQTCGTVFASQFQVDNSFGSTFAGCQSGPCPCCGQVGRIPDGTFNFIGDAAEVIESSTIDSGGLQELIDLVRRMAVDPSVTPEQVADAVAEKSPTLGPVLAKYLVPRSSADFYAMLAVLIALLGLLITFTQGDHHSAPTTEIINQVINNCVNNPPLPPLTSLP